ncbi:unnamed protein product [Amoebophrya sp. A120]|nr:unnamed protein product [Amoebophrya sp. A120]|eukprot:GSA120T00007943001.1
MKGSLVVFLQLFFSDYSPNQLSPFARGQLASSIDATANIRNLDALDETDDPTAKLPASVKEQVLKLKQELGDVSPGMAQQAQHLMAINPKLAKQARALRDDPQAVQQMMNDPQIQAVMKDPQALQNMMNMLEENGGLADR